jgi:hypothetical protein
VAKNVSQEVEELKVIYKEIIDGYTYDNGKKLYIKHLNEIEHGELARKRASLFFNFKKEGLPTEEEKLKHLIESEAWSQDQEEEVVNLRHDILNNQKNLPKVIVEQQPAYQKVIDTLQTKLDALVEERRGLIGATAEEYAERESLGYYLSLCFYTDPQLTQKLFKVEGDFDELEVDEINDYVRVVRDVFARFTEDKVKRIATMSFFLNYFSNCKESVYHFLCKPIYSLTTYQLLLISLGSRNLSIISQADGSPPELIDGVKIEEVVNWYDQQYSILLGKRNTGK